MSGDNKTVVNPFTGKLQLLADTSGLIGAIVWEEDDFVATQGQSIFVLSATPKANSIFMFREGQYLREGASRDYTRSGVTITLNADVASSINAGENVSVKYCT